MGGDPGPSSTTLPAGSPPLGPSLSHQLAGLRKLYWGQDMDTQPAQSPKAWSWPPAGFPPAHREVPGDNGNTGRRAACLPSPRPHISKPCPKSQETPEQGLQPRLQVRATSRLQTTVLLSWHSSGTSVLKAPWWVLRVLWVETH